MLRTLEIAWLCITILSVGIAVYQFFNEGWESALWMLFVTLVSVVMFSIRRKQRMRYENKDEKELYHWEPNTSKIKNRWSLPAKRSAFRHVGLFVNQNLLRILCGLTFVHFVVNNKLKIENLNLLTIFVNERKYWFLFRVPLF